MPRNNDLRVDSDEFTEVTNADVTRITLQNKSISEIHVTASVGGGSGNQPDAQDNTVGTVLVEPGKGWENKLLSDVFPGIPGANRVWVRSNSDQAEVFVSHA